MPPHHSTLSTPPPTLALDAVIIGGGIAGLWTLARLAGEGYSCLLLEREALGAGQTIASQGIIHGGIKYTLGLADPGEASKQIAEMPAIWTACLEGRGEVDLRAATVLSPHQYLWTAPGLASRLAGFGASRVIRTAVTRLKEDERPPVFAGAPRGVDVYRVEEPVLDTASVLAALAAPLAARIARIDAASPTPPIRFEPGEGAAPRAAAVRLAGAEGPPLRLAARRWILTAGAGNAGLIRAALPGTPAPMQLRPLHMAIVRHPKDSAPPPLFGHCLGPSSLPRLTINTARALSGETVWWVGGAIAETGVGRTAPEQADAAARELRACLPWLDLSRAAISTFRIDRAEGATPGTGAGKPARPDGPVVNRLGDLIAGWPTKLAFAPAFAARVLAMLREDRVEPTPRAADTALPAFPAPPVAPYPWEA